MRRFLLLAVMLLLTITFGLHAEDWLHWRGPTQNGVSHDTGLPDDWSNKQVGANNLIWKQPYGGRSTPLVSKGRVYIIGNAGEGLKEGERVTCFDGATGKVLWEHKFNVFHTDIVSSRVGWANLAGDAETGNVYAHGVQGLFFCFAPDGKVLWSKSLTEEYGRITGYGGRVTSPIVVDDLVIIHFLNASWGELGRGGHRFLAMDKKTGEVRWWSTPGGQPLDTIYPVPVTARIGDQHLLICGGADGGIHAIKVATGEKVWSYPIARRGLNSSAVVDEKKGHVYVTQSEENLSTNEQGCVLCLDATKIQDGKPAKVWQKFGILAGYASPILHEGRLYVCDNDCKMHCMKAENGEVVWEFKYGRNNCKGSPVLADGKIYVTETGARFHILKPGADKCERLSTVKFYRPDDQTVELSGSPAIADGRVYFTTSDETYCIGTGQGKASATPPEKPAAPKKDGKPTHLQVLPADIVLSAGESASFRLKAFDQYGQECRLDGTATWALPTTPPPPGAPANTPPLPAIQGTVADGKLTLAKDVPSQSGIVIVKVKVGDSELTGRARVRVAPLLPYAQDFETIADGRIPTGWINLPGKFQVVVLKDGNHVLKKLANNPNPLLARANLYIGMPNLADYTIEADIMGSAKEEAASGGKVINLPDMGLINSRYSLVLDGNKQHLFIRSWEAKRRLDKTIPFPWKGGEWYHFKLQVVQEGDKAVARGKVYPKGQPEPSNWTIEVEDPSPNLSGSPALYAYATGIPTEGQGVGAEIFYDNVKIVPNKAKSN